MLTQILAPLYTQPCDSWQDALPPARDWERSLEGGAEDSHECVKNGWCIVAA